MVAAAGGAPAVSTRTPRGAPALRASDALASPMSTVGAAHRNVTASSATSRKTAAGSTFRRHTWHPPIAVTIQVKVQPLAWNIGSVHKYRSAGVIGICTSMPTAFTHALRCVIITPLGRDVVPLV